MENEIEEKAKAYYSSLQQAIDELDYTTLSKIATILIDAYKDKKTVFIFGNGGSASTASHLACDLSKGTLKNAYDSEEKRFRIISLTDNVASLTAIANDISYEDIFSQQLHNLVREGDVVIAISGSGNSPNVVKALEAAKKGKAVTIGFLGFNDGGEARSLCDYSMVVQSENYGVIEDFHSSLGHVLTVLLAFLKHHHDSNEKV